MNTRKTVFYSLLISLLMSLPGYGAVLTAALSKDQISTMRIHTSKNPANGARKIATLKTTHLDSSCSKGIFVDVVEDSETYSMMLAAFMAGRNIEVRYDTDVKAPWGDTNYYQLVHFDIVN